MANNKAFKIKNGLEATRYLGTTSTLTAVTGMTSSFLQTSGDNSNWVQKTADISAYGGAVVRPVYHYDMIASVFTADLQLDIIVIGGNTYDFESNATGWQTTTTDTAIGSYDSASFVDVATATTAGRVNRDEGGTPSTGTGRINDPSGSGGFYLYFETTSPANNAGYDFLLRGPEITLPDNPTWTWYEARAGTSMGNLDAYLYLSNYVLIVDTSQANSFTFTPSGNTAINFTNPPASGTAIGFTLEVVNTGGYTLTWPSSVKWHLATTPTATATKEVYTFITTDGGTTYYGKKAGENLA